MGPPDYEVRGSASKEAATLENRGFFVSVIIKRRELRAEGFYESVSFVEAERLARRRILWGQIRFLIL